MKKFTILAIFILFFVNLIAQKNYISPQLDSNDSLYNPSNEVLYLIGSNYLDDYPVCIKKTCIIDSCFISQCPVLVKYVVNKEMFIGGILKDITQNKKTKIKDIKLEKTENHKIKFTVVGKRFSRSFTLETGEILDVKKESTLFYSINDSVWLVIKKNKKS